MSVTTQVPVDARPDSFIAEAVLTDDCGSEISDAVQVGAAAGGRVALEFRCCVSSGVVADVLFRTPDGVRHYVPVRSGERYLRKGDTFLVTVKIDSTGNALQSWSPT